MQNNNNLKGFRRFLRNNGYYLVIGLCALAIGVSGYFLLRGDNSQDTEETLSIPATVKTDGEEESNPQENTGKDEEEAGVVEEEAEPAISEIPSDDTAETADNLTPEETEPAMRIVVQPGDRRYAGRLQHVRSLLQRDNP